MPALFSRCEVAVVGAGPAGSAAAFFLARSGVDVLLIDRAEFPRDKTCGDALGPRALKVLEAMGALAQVAAQGQAIRKIRFVSPEGLPVEGAIPHYPGHPPYALVLPRRTLDDVIRRQAVGAGAHYSGRTHIVRLNRTPSGVELIEGEGGRPIQARAAVLATGANTSLLRASGIHPRRSAHTVAARAYAQGLDHDAETIDFHFDGVPLPGYGWVFPTASGRANVGAITLGDSAAFRGLGRNPRRLFEAFQDIPGMRSTLHGARWHGPIESYPVRTDFAHAPTFAPRVLLAGEACGLVNPLTGEGIDYALESGQIAAEFLVEILPHRSISAHDWRQYDRRLRRRFQRLFVYTGRMQALYLQPWFLNRFLRLAQSRTDLQQMLVDITQGMRDAAQGTSPRTVLQVLRAR